MPDEQGKLLERIMQLGVADGFGRNEETGRWAIVYTKKRREFLDMVRSVAEGDDEHRLVRLAALDALTVSQGNLWRVAEK